MQPETYKSTLSKFTNMTEIRSFMLLRRNTLFFKLFPLKANKKAFLPIIRGDVKLKSLYGRNNKNLTNGWAFLYERTEAPFKLNLSIFSIVLFFLSFLTSFSFATNIKAIPESSSIYTAKKLVKRLMPGFADRFEFKLLDSKTDVFELETQKRKVVIGGNNANSMAVGLNYYLKYYCHTSVSWYKADSIYLPKQLPLIKYKIKQLARCKNRFFLNYCTFGYTMPWWKWSDWQWFIDWMALNGVNMPLAITGQEGVWQSVWKKLGLDDQQIRSYFTGPAYLPWHRMANIDHWDGPLPQSWIDNQVQLQKEILNRERELNMTPVLPAFAGHVPEVLKTKYPDAKISSLGNWGGFTAEYHSFFLDSFDPLFNLIQKEYINEQNRLFGSDHIYGIDPFNEVTPPSWEPDYLAGASSNIFKSLKLADPQSKWLQMTWMFYYQKKDWKDSTIKAYLTGVPQNNMILLDYFCENVELWKTTNKFYGQPYIWCYLGNFGGNTSLSGDLKDVENRMENAFQNGGSNLWGVGSTLEGFDCNPMMYEYVFEKAWSKGPVNLDDWVSNWSSRRLGRKNADAQKAWSILLDKIYLSRAQLGQAPVNNTRPLLHGRSSNIKYDNKDLLNVWQLMLNVEDKEIPKVYQFDVVNVGRQVLGNYFSVLKNRFTECYEKKDLNGLKVNGQQMLSLMDDLNTLLASNDSFLLGKWLYGAKKFGTNEMEQKYYEADARRIITTWGAAGRGLNDYANRSWADLTKTYYKPRWEKFINEIIVSTEKNETFDEKRFKNEIESFEGEWTKTNDAYPSVASGQSIPISKNLYKKYAPDIQSTTVK